MKYQSIAVQNNECVYMLARHDYGTAIAKLTSLVSAWRGLTPDEHTIASDERSSRISDRGKITPSLDALLTTSSMKCPAMFHPDRENDLHDDDGFLYQSCILFPLDLDLSRCDNAFVASVIVFNLTLAHHLWARSRLTESSNHSNDRIRAITPRKILIRAVHLYDNCFKLCQEYKQHPKGSILFRLTIVNNMGVLYRELDSHDSTQKCFQYVLAVLMALTAYYGKPPKNRILEHASEETIGGFFANTTALVVRANAAPAA
jgi:hypothetical protein